MFGQLFEVYWKDEQKTWGRSSWYLEKNIKHLILWKKEATSMGTGAMNFYNNHTWAFKNSHSQYAHSFQH